MRFSALDKIFDASILKEYGFLDIDLNFELKIFINASASALDGNSRTEAGAFVFPKLIKGFPDAGHFEN